MRQSYLVCYDIADDKRLRKVFKTMRGYRPFAVFGIRMSVHGERSDPMPGGAGANHSP